MCYFNIFIGPYCICINSKTVILSCNFAPACHHIFYRVVESTMSMMHFKSGDIYRQGE